MIAYAPWLFLYTCLNIILLNTPHFITANRGLNEIVFFSMRCVMQGVLNKLYVGIGSMYNMWFPHLLPITCTAKVK